MAWAGADEASKKLYAAVKSGDAEAVEAYVTSGEGEEERQTRALEAFQLAIHTDQLEICRQMLGISVRAPSALLQAEAMP